jgi:hypothetical protein
VEAGPLNHASIDITADFYAHVEKNEKRRAFESIQADQKSRKMSRNADRKAG